MSTNTRLAITSAMRLLAASLAQPEGLLKNDHTAALALAELVSLGRGPDPWRVDHTGHAPRLDERTVEEEADIDRGGRKVGARWLVLPEVLLKTG